MKNTIPLRSLGLLCLLCLIPLWAFAQKVSVKGVVKDATGESVIGASVIEKGTTNGTITDFDGNFVLSVAKDATLSISFVGYQTQEVSVSGKTSFNIILKEDTEILDEVVVVGYGQMKRSDLTGRLFLFQAMQSARLLQLLLIRYCKVVLPVFRYRLTQVCRELVHQSVFVVLTL